MNWNLHWNPTFVVWFHNVFFFFCFFLQSFQQFVTGRFVVNVRHSYGSIETPQNEPHTNIKHNMNMWINVFFFFFFFFFFGGGGGGGVVEEEVAIEPWKRIHVCSTVSVVLPGCRSLVNNDLDQRALESRGLLFTRMTSDRAMELRLWRSVAN